jgi:hypothetical protein
MRPALLGFGNIGTDDLNVVGMFALLVFHRQVDEFAHQCLQRLGR